MRNAVIVSAVRTPVGRFGGALRTVKASTLGSYAIKAAVERINLDPADVDEVIFGHVLANGENPNVARLAWLEAGYPEEVPGYTVDRQCGSGLQAIVNAALLVQTGDAEVVVAGGAESESNAEFYTTATRWGARLGDTQLYDRIVRHGYMVSCPEVYPPMPGMMHTSENLAERYGITREEADAFAYRSQMNAAAAIRAGKFKAEIVPVPVRGPKGEVTLVEADEHPRPDTTLEGLARLPVLVGKIHTAGNASGINDGAAAVVVMAEEAAKRRGLRPLAYLRGWAAAGVNPTIMGIGPAPAIRKLVEKTGVRLEEVDLVEINEAFAAQVLAVIRELGVSDYTNWNVNGSGIALGHPLGATGARISITTSAGFQTK